MLSSNVFSLSQLMQRANHFSRQRALDHHLRYHVANAGISLPSLLSRYPGPVQIVCVQVVGRGVHRFELL